MALLAALALCIWQGASGNFFSGWFLVPLGFLAALLSQKKKFTGSGWLSRESKASAQVEYEKLQQTETQAAENVSEGWEQNRPDIPEGEKDGYLELAKMCCSPDSYRNLVPFFSSLKDYTGDEKYLTTLNYVMDHFDNLDINFIMRLDVSEGVEDLEWRLKNFLADNFNLELPLPTAADFSDDTAIANDGVMEKFDDVLREYGYQMSFIDTKSDEYVILLHQTKDRDSAKDLVEAIGYDYYELRLGE